METSSKSWNVGNGGSLHEDCIKNGWPIKFPPDKAFVVPKAYHHQLDQSCRASSVVAVVLNSKYSFTLRWKKGYKIWVNTELISTPSKIYFIFNMESVWSLKMEQFFSKSLAEACVQILPALETPVALHYCQPSLIGTSRMVASPAFWIMSHFDSSQL